MTKMCKRAFFFQRTEENLGLRHGLTYLSSIFEKIRLAENLLE
jgi:hypothetical protein